MRTDTTVATLREKELIYHIENSGHDHAHIALKKKLEHVVPKAVYSDQASV